MIMGRSRRIVYTGSFRFPEGDAAAARVLGIAKALRQEGYEVIIAGGEEEGPPQDRDTSKGYYYQGFRCLPQGHLSRSGSSVRCAYEYVWRGCSTARWLGTQQRLGIDAIIAYDPGTPLLLRLDRFARSARVPLILDLAEWHQGSHLPGGWLGLRSIDTELRMRYLHATSGHVITISSYLADFYRAKGSRVIRVPPLVDLAEPKWQTVLSKASRPLRLVYAGNPGKKDLLPNIIRGLALLGNKRQDVQLHLIGVTPEQVAALWGAEGAPPARSDRTIVWRGRVSQSCVPQILAACDYSVLLRPHSRYAEAGFPTKLVESLSAGLPIITNVTSDISEYVQDLDQGAIVPGYTPIAFAKTVERVLSLSSEHHQRMREKAKERAMLSFDYRGYAQQIGQFVGEAIHKSH